MKVTADTITDEQLLLIEQYAACTGQEYLCRAAQRARGKKVSGTARSRTGCKDLCAKHLAAAVAWTTSLDNTATDPTKPVG